MARLSPLVLVQLARRTVATPTSSAQRGASGKRVLLLLIATGLLVNQVSAQQASTTVRSVSQVNFDTPRLSGPRERKSERVGGSSTVRRGAVVGAMLGAVVGGVAGSQVGTGCLRAPCNSAAKRRGFVVGLAGVGGLIGSGIGALVGRLARD